MCASWVRVWAKYWERQNTRTVWAAKDEKCNRVTRNSGWFQMLCCCCLSFRVSSQFSLGSVLFWVYFVSRDLIKPFTTEGTQRLLCSMYSINNKLMSCREFEIWAKRIERENDSYKGAGEQTKVGKLAAVYIVRSAHTLNSWQWNGMILEMVNV